MKNLSKQILNYFSTFTETRFSFRRLVNYRWTNNEFTQDLSLFPEFQNELLYRIKTGSLSSISIKQGMYSLSLPKEQVIVQLEARLKENFDKAYLETCIQDYITGIEQSIQVNLNGEAELKQNPQAVELAWKEGTRKFNIALRKELEGILIKSQQQIIDSKKEDLGITHLPQSTFGINNYLQEHFNSWQAIAKETKDIDDYIRRLNDYIQANIKDIILYDLFFSLQKYQEASKLGTVYVFFHIITQGDNAFPLYYLELELRSLSTEVLITFPRDLLLINTPAINSYKFDQVLTTPRSCTLSKADAYLGQLEVFLQTEYGKATTFIFEPSFREILHDTPDRPTIKARIGLQTITNEDKKLLDYSEIMTGLDTGKDSQFTRLVTDYIEGKIPNYQEDIVREYKTKYPAKSSERYIPNSPIPINDSQKRILLALAKKENRLMVIDGPPGTGKSHTIAALTYWANENKKSVVITSHKKEALDVIDRMLTDKFKKLHPQSKPSIVRMDKETGSENSLQNTLQTSVINSANDRALEFNDEAINIDADNILTNIKNDISDRIDKSVQTVDKIQKLVEYNLLLTELQKDNAIKQAFCTLPKYGSIDTAVEHINLAREQGVIATLSNTSLDEYNWIYTKQSQLDEFLEACEKINRVPEESLSIETTITSLPEDYHTLLTDLLNTFRQDIPLKDLSITHGAGNFLSNILGNGTSKEQKEELLQKLNSLRHSSIVEEIANSIGKSKQDITLSELNVATEKISFKINFAPYQAWLDEYKSLPGNQNKGVIQIYNTVRQHKTNKTSFDSALGSAFEVLFDTYGQLLLQVSITKNNLSSLHTLTNDTAKNIWRAIELHSKLADSIESSSKNNILLKDYFELEQKRIENINDTRLKDLNKHLADLQRIKVSYEGGKRFTREEADILLSGLSCIVAEPSTISKYFPMEEEIIDVLIIDEASQVSIADSISLMLRAKQVVIFGDEYQYGAVSAVNVSAKYSASYFSEIINAYQDDFNTKISDEERNTFIADVSKEVSAEDQEIESTIKSNEIAPGTILWLKTFNIRTSTLAFAKAMANYTTSLKEHFRSFPEIISYSNDTFYKQAQLELIVNRIRTKPITEVLQFIRVETQGQMAPNTNLDEIDSIIKDIEQRIAAGFTGSIGIITSFKEQQARMEQAIQERMDMPQLRQNHKLNIWFVGDVQGEERDIIYYSFVENKEIANANLTSIYPVIGGTADNIRALKMQRLNVGFSRAKDTMIFVHSQDIESFSNTRLGDALKHYKRILEESKKNDMFIVDESLFDSPKELELYQLLMQTKFVKDNKDLVHIIPQFPIGKYLRAEFAAKIPQYRVDFLLTYNQNGNTNSLILEYDGLEYHFKNQNEVPSNLLSSEYIDYDIQRQLELESYGYRFLRINYFTLLPEHENETKVDVLDRLLTQQFT